MMLDQLRNSPLLDTSVSELDGARRVTYLVEQTFRYDYDAPIEALHHRLVAVPRDRHGDQRLREHQLRVSGATLRRRTAVDRHGNRIIRFTADRVEQGFELHLAAVLERRPLRADLVLPAAELTDPHWRRPTPLTTPDDAIRALAAASADTTDPVERALALTSAAHGALTYEYGVTGVTTTAAQALALGRGVCQDSAHLLLALCHAAGLPARYVSGHLLGQGGTHAWAEILVPHRRGARVLAVDPCNDRLAGAAYLTVAVGRDYRDVPPTSGRYSGGDGRLTAGRRVGVLAVA